MDAVIFISICLYIVVKQMNTVDEVSTDFENMEVEDVTRVAKLNDSFYEDDNAFMDIAHVLGFPAGR